MTATPIGRVSFPHLFKPNTFKGKTKFAVTLIFDEDADLSELQKEIDAAIKKKWPNKDDIPEDFYYPILDGNKKGKKNAEYKGKKYVTLKSNVDHPPVIRGKKKSDVLEPKDIYAGCFGRASYNVYTWDTGVGLGLLGFQKTDDGPKFSSGGNPDDDFDLDDVDDDPVF